MLDNRNPLAPIVVGSGLLITINGGIVLINGTPITVQQTTVSLTPSSSNSVYINSSGTVIVGTSGFPPSNIFPVATISTNASVITSIIDSRPDYSLPVTLGTNTRGITINIDGGGQVPTTGVRARWSAPVACTITGWVLVADQSGSAVIDILRGTYSAFPTTSSIASTDKPTLSNVQKNENLAVSVWTTAISSGDILEFNLSSVTSCTVLTLTLNITVP